MHNGRYAYSVSPEIVSAYDQEIPQSQTADNPMAPRGRAAQPSIPEPFARIHKLCKMAKMKMINKDLFSYALKVTWIRRFITGTCKWQDYILK